MQVNFHFGKQAQQVPAEGLSWKSLEKSHLEAIQRQLDMESRAEDLVSMTIDKQVGDKMESSE